LVYRIRVTPIHGSRPTNLKCWQRKFIKRIRKNYKQKRSAGGESWSRLGEHVGETVVTCGLVVEQRTHHQITGEPMKFLTLADLTGMVETELFAENYKSYGLATVRYPVLEVTATVEPFENGRGFSLRVLRAGKPRQTKS
jgi:DNA polymerase III alpha subunit